MLGQWMLSYTHIHTTVNETKLSFLNDSANILGLFLHYVERVDFIV